MNDKSFDTRQPAPARRADARSRVASFGHDGRRRRRRGSLPRGLRLGREEPVARVPPARRRAEEDRSCGDRHVRHARRSSTGPTGPSTSTSTTRPRPARRSRRSRSRPASRSTTPRTTSTTTSSTPRSRPLLAGRQGHRARRVVQHRLDGRAPHPPGLRPEARPRQHPQRQEPRGLPQERRVRPGPALLAALAERLRRHRLQPQGHRRQEGRDDDPAAHRPVAQGQGHAADRDARHRRPRDDGAGQGHLEVHRRRLPGRDRRDPAGQGCRPDQGLHRQRVHRRARQGRHRRLRGVDRRRRPAAVRRPQHPVHPAREGLHAVVRQLRHPGAGQAQEERREAHRLLLRPRGHGPGRGLRQLHRAGRGNQGGAGEDRPELAANPLIVPPADVLARAQVFRGLTPAEETKYSKMYASITAG